MTAAAPEPAPAEDQSFPLLDAYLEDLQAGKNPERAPLLAAHPELAGMLDCLEGLEQLAPPRDPTATHDAERTLPATATALRAEVDEFATGTEFGKYELLGEIGRGGMGVIYKARQKDLDRLVAIKMILSSRLASTHQVDRFTIEARAMARVHHPHIVRVHETGFLHGQHYFVMEYIQGPSLAEVNRQEPLPREKSVRLVAQVARAVQHLHEQGIVHRDLKPSNVLLEWRPGEAAPIPYVTDFGLAKVLGGSAEATASGAVLGTPAYMAPEQALGRGDRVGPQSDVYSLGAILYELLTGRPPFQEETPLATLVQVIESEPTQLRLINPDLPRQLELICLKCLEKDPAQRYASAAALADDLERFLNGDEVEARPPGLRPVLRRWARREPALVYRLGGLGVLLGVVQVHYQLAGEVDFWGHVKVQGLLAGWMLASVLCQHWLKRQRRADLARLAWVGADVTCLSAILALVGGQTTSLLVGYPFLIAASGLWFQVELVWFTTAVCETAYIVLLSSEPGLMAVRFLHFHIIFMVALALIGFVVAYQVQRILVLNRYYENRPLP